MINIDDIKDIINNPNTIKVVETVNVHGIPHAAIKQSLHVDDEGNVEYVELFESSKSYKNITRSLWYNKKVSILIYDGADKSYEIIGKPVKILVSGKKYEKIYTEILKKKGFDIAAVITVVPEDVENQGSQGKFSEQEKSKIFFKHLDRLKN